MAAFDSNNGHVKHIKHWKPCLGALTCYFRTNNRLLINTSCMILPTGHWGMAAFNSNMVHVKHMTLWKPCLGALMCHLVTNNRLLLHALCVILPTGQWGMPHYCQPATGVLGHMKHWKPCLGALMCYFGTNNRFLIYASCVILPTGQRGTPHYSQPATEEWNHLTTLWGTWITSNIENHLGGRRCVIFDHIIQSRCLSYRRDSQPASEKRPLLPTGHWGTAAVWGDRAH